MYCCHSIAFDYAISTSGVLGMNSQNTGKPFEALSLPPKPNKVKLFPVKIGWSNEIVIMTG